MNWRRAVVIGATGGIGHALADRLEAEGSEVVRLGRSAGRAEDRIDLLDETSIAVAAERVAAGAPPDCVIVATGMLQGVEGLPEKSWRALSHEGLAQSFAINAVGPALVAKHFLPLLPREGRCVFAALSARVGSISDNGLGGWYSYRASKAALNMLVRTLAIELARKRPGAICVALHPGTVDTRLSEPFQANVPDRQLFTPERSAAHLLDVLGTLRPEQSGRIFAWDGSEIRP